jgi:6-phosphogluconolactonase
MSKRIEWQKTHIFWGDERLVEPVHPDSNYGVAFRALVSKVDVPPANIHRVITESRSASAAAEEYEQTLRHFFCPPAESEDHAYFPSFDVILLGLGQDGHTASLFPGDPALEEKYRWVVAVSGARGSPPIPRITLTFPVINKARCAIFLASGREKREVFQKIISNHETVAYPAARVRPSGKLLWFVDELMV